MRPGMHWMVCPEDNWSSIRCFHSKVDADKAADDLAQKFPGKKVYLFEIKLDADYLVPTGIVEKVTYTK